MKVVFSSSVLENVTEERIDQYLRHVAERGFFRRAGGSRSRQLVSRGGYLPRIVVSVRNDRNLRADQRLLKIELDLNPTRFLAHRDERRSAFRRIRSELLLVANGEVSARLRALTLDGNDNVLTDADRHVGRPGFWNREVLGPYLGAVLHAVERNLTPEENSSWVGEDRRSVRQLVFRANWSAPVVRQAEIYWEFSVDDAVAFVHQFHRHAAAVFHEHDSRMFGFVPLNGNYEQAPARHRENNATGISLALGPNGVRLSIYAKLRDRVRFEVQYGRSISELSPRLRRDQIPEGAAGIVRLLNHAKNDARGRLEQIFDRFPNFEIDARPMGYFLVRLLSRLASAAEGDQVQIARSLTMLVHNGGISLQSAGSDPIVEQLVREGILVRHRSQRRERVQRFVLAPNYRLAISALGEAVEVGTPGRGNREA